jgi:anti-sigma-K factor RskA
MNLAELERKLIAAARSQPPADRVPYAFAKRVMSLVQTRPVMDGWALWAGALWRSAAACVAVLLVVGALAFFLPPTTHPSSDLSQDFENTMLAAADQEPDLPQ